MEDKHVVLAGYKENFKSREFAKRVHDFAENAKKFGHCDKCNSEVRPENNALVFDYIKGGGKDWTTFFGGNRHLEPVSGEDGVVTCEGSPSRFQKINGIPDPRPEYHKPAGQDELSLAIWQWMQAEFGEKPVDTPKTITD